MPRLVFALLAVFLLAPTATGANASRRTHNITVDDYFTQADIFGSKISPDGKSVVWVEGRWLKSTDDRKTDLWVVGPHGTRRLTNERANDRAPAWTRDNQFLYFLGDRKREGEKHAPYNGKTQVWRLSPDGGQPLAVTRVEEGVTAFELSFDSRSLYYVTEVDHHDADEWKTLRQQFKQIEYGYGARKVSQVWKLDLEHWRAEKLIDEQRVIHEMAVSPTGAYLAMITTSDGTVVSQEGRSRVDIYARQTRKVRPLPDKVFRADAPSPYGWLEHLAWRRGTPALAFNVIFDGYPAEVIVAEWKGPEPAVFKMPRPREVSLRGYGSPLAWRGEDLGFLGEEKARIRLYCARNLKSESQPEFDVLTQGDVAVGSFSFSDEGGQAAVVMNDTTHLPDVYVVDRPLRPTRLTNVNPQVDTWKLPQLSAVSWQGAKGDTVQGILELPPDYKPGQKVPLVVEIHGGPTTAASVALQFWIYGRTLLPAQGYAVLCPNYRGSTGYGDKFLTELIGRENDVEVEDILKGVDALVERGIADPERLAVSGWSNGGYLTNCLISKSTRFKAAISGAGIVDAVLEFGSSDEPAYTIAFKQGFPWNKAAQYQKASPTWNLDKIRTPTLIHVGESDVRCPPAHSRMLYRVLREYNHVPTELLVYPGEGHGVMKYANRKAKMEWDLAWLGRYLLGKSDIRNANP